MNLQEPLKNELKLKPTWNENMSKEVIKQGEAPTENKTKQINKSSNNKAKQTNKSSVVNENAAQQPNKSSVVNTKKAISTNRPILRKLKKVKLGDICILKISALGPKGIGIDEYSYSNSIFIMPPTGGVDRNTNLGETVKAKIIKNNQKGNKYSIARVLEVIKKPMSVQPITIQPDEVLTVNIEKLTSKGAGIVTLKNDYKLIIPNANIGKDIQVVVTRVKSKYGFAKVFQDNVKIGSKNNKWKPDGVRQKLSGASLLEGSKYTLTLPKVGKYFGKYAIVKLNNSIVFIKLNLRAKPGNKVRIKITKINSKFALAKIVQINPISLLKKRILVQNSIRQMVKNGMHLGEKVVKCNARMKKYVWLKKQGKNQNRPLIQKGRHIINLLKTRRCLNKALTQLSKYAVKGRTFLFIGTKKPAASLIARASLFSKTSFFVNTRWLGGMLTNWKTILKSISKIRPILKEKQKILADILEQRQSLKNHLMKKALFLKTKSQLILNKGRFLIARLKNPTSKLDIL